MVYICDILNHHYTIKHHHTCTYMPLIALTIISSLYSGGKSLEQSFLSNALFKIIHSISANSTTPSYSGEIAHTLQIDELVGKRRLSVEV